MSKSKPLPPRRSDGASLNASLPLPKGGSSTGRLGAVVERLAHKPPRMECRAVHCPANELCFNEMAVGMEAGGWELVAVVPHERFISLNGNSGVGNGWMTFWRRIAQSQAEEDKSEKSA